MKGKNSILNSQMWMWERNIPGNEIPGNVFYLVMKHSMNQIPPKY